MTHRRSPLSRRRVRPKKRGGHIELRRSIQHAYGLVMPDQMPSSPSDHLLRTLASVPVSSQILDLGCGDGGLTEALLRLGFPVHACDPRPTAIQHARAAVAELIGEESAQRAVQETPLDAIDYPAATFDWVIVSEAELYVSDESDLQTLFDETRPLLTPGGWLYMTVATSPPLSTVSSEDGRPRFSVETVEACRTEAELAEACAPDRVETPEGPRIRAIYRRVDAETPSESSSTPRS